MISYPRTTGTPLKSIHTFVQIIHPSYKNNAFYLKPGGTY